jgi:uncharacterized membrane protein
LHGWFEFVAVLAAFVISHTVPVRPPIRRRLGAVLGDRGFAIVYSLVSLALLYWLVVAAQRAPYVEVWPQALWQRWAPTLVMPFVCLLLAFGVGAPNPLSFGGAGDARFNPARPGMAAVARHPVLLALVLWSTAHAVPNGDLAHLMLFGLFAGFAALGMVMIDSRKRRLMGDDEWQKLSANTSLLSIRALCDARVWPEQGAMPLIRLAAAAALYAASALLHAPLFGVSPWPA